MLEEYSSPPTGILSSWGGRVCSWTSALTMLWEGLWHVVRPFCQRQVLKMDFTKKCRLPMLPAAERMSPWTTMWGICVTQLSAASLQGSCENSLSWGCKLLSIMHMDSAKFIRRWRWCPWNDVGRLPGYSWPLNNRDLNYAAALYTDFFSIFTTIL